MVVVWEENLALNTTKKADSRITMFDERMTS